MASRRDLFQSYQFMMQRLVSGLVLRESDPLQTPLRRMVGSAFGSVMIAIIVLVVAAVIGLISPGGNKSWQAGDSIIVEKETGSRYVWIADGPGDYALHPVPNMGSAALILGSPSTITVSRKSLIDVPRGPMLGIPGTAMRLPAAEHLLGYPWTLCSLPAENRAGVLVPNTALALGAGTDRGDALGDRAVVVQDIELGLVYLVWNHHRYLMPDPTAAMTALGISTHTQVRVGTAWLTAIPAGKDLAPVVPSGAGSPSAAMPDRVVGSVLVVTAASGDDYYLVENDGLRPLTLLEASLTMQVSGPAARVEQSAIAAMPVKADPPIDPADPPHATPEIAEPRSVDSTVCASFSDNPATPEISLEAGVEGAETAPATIQRTAAGVVLADRVLVSGGHGALVQSMASPTDQGGTLFLVTDEGKRFAIPDTDSLRALGLESATPIRLPAALVSRIEEGAALDPSLARREI